MCVSLTIAMQISCFVYSVILQVALWLQECFTCLELSHQREYLQLVLFISLWPRSFYGTCKAFDNVCYQILLFCGTAISQNSATLTYT